MPQIASTHHAEFIKSLNAQGVSVKEGEMRVGDLKPTQSELNTAQMAGIPENRLRDSVFVSNDGYILDGHHRWGKLNEQSPDNTIKVRQVDLPIRQLLDRARSFDKTSYKTAQETGATKPPARGSYHELVSNKGKELVSNKKPAGEDPAGMETVHKAAAMSHQIAGDWQKKLAGLGVKVVMGGSLVSGLALPSAVHDMDVRFLYDGDRESIVPDIEAATGLKFRKTIKIGGGDQGPESDAHMIEGKLTKDGVTFDVEGQLRNTNYTGWAKYYPQVLSPAEMATARGKKMELRHDKKAYKAYKQDLLAEVMKRVKEKGLLPGAAKPETSYAQQIAEKSKSSAPAAEVPRGVKGTLLNHLARVGYKGMTPAELRTAMGANGQHADEAIKQLDAAGKLDREGDRVKIKGAVNEAARAPVAKPTPKHAGSMTPSAFAGDEAPSYAKQIDEKRKELAASGGVFGEVPHGRDQAEAQAQDIKDTHKSTRGLAAPATPAKTAKKPATIRELYDRANDMTMSFEEVDRAIDKHFEHLGLQGAQIAANSLGIVVMPKSLKGIREKITRTIHERMARAEKGQTIAHMAGNKDAPMRATGTADEEWPPPPDKAEVISGQLRDLMAANDKKAAEKSAAKSYAEQVALQAERSSTNFSSEAKDFAKKDAGYQAAVKAFASAAPAEKDARRAAMNEALKTAIAKYHELNPVTPEAQAAKDKAIADASAAHARRPDLPLSVQQAGEGGPGPSYAKQIAERMKGHEPYPARPIPLDQAKGMRAGQGKRSAFIHGAPASTTSYAQYIADKAKSAAAAAAPETTASAPVPAPVPPSAEPLAPRGKPAKAPPNPLGWGGQKELQKKVYGEVSVKPEKAKKKFPSPPAAAAPKAPPLSRPDGSLEQTLRAKMDKQIAAQTQATGAKAAAAARPFAPLGTAGAEHKRTFAALHKNGFIPNQFPTRTAQGDYLAKKTGWVRKDPKTGKWQAFTNEGAVGHLNGEAPGAPEERVPLERRKVAKENKQAMEDLDNRLWEGVGAQKAAPATSYADQIIAANAAQAKAAPAGPVAVTGEDSTYDKEAWLRGENGTAKKGISGFEKAAQGKGEMLLKGTMKEGAAKAATLPPSPDGLRAPTIRLTGDMERDLFRFGDVDTHYLDTLYSKMNQTGLYRGNNEVFRSLHNTFNSVKEAADSGAPLPADQVAARFDNRAKMFDDAAAALSELGHGKLAEFYAGVGGGLAENAKQYALEKLARPEAAPKARPAPSAASMTKPVPSKQTMVDTIIAHAEKNYPRNRAGRVAQDLIDVAAGNREGNQHEKDMLQKIFPDSKPAAPEPAPARDQHREHGQRVVDAANYQSVEDLDKRLKHVREYANGLGFENAINDPTALQRLEGEQAALEDKRAEMVAAGFPTGKFGRGQQAAYAKQIKEAREKMNAGTAKAAAPPAPGMVRLYHGGVAYKGGPRWLTPDRAYAEGYAKKNANGNAFVHYVDMPEDHPLLTKAFDDTGTSQKAPINHFDAPEEIARQLRPYPSAGDGAAKDTVAHHLGIVKKLHDETTKTMDAPKIEQAMADLRQLPIGELQALGNAFLPSDAESKRFWAKEMSRLSRPKIVKEIERKITATHKAIKANEI
jgi:hypothetical protein